jgi:hypothetical protein
VEKSVSTKKQFVLSPGTGYLIVFSSAVHPVPFAAEFGQRSAIIAV